MGLYFLFALLFSLANVIFAAPALRTRPQQIPSDVPEFVLKYVCEEVNFPTDLTAFLRHTTPKVSYSPVANAPSPITLSNLNQLGSDVYLTSNDDVTSNPEWLRGSAPDSNSITSGTNSIIVINVKEDNSVDVFYFYFYAFNPGTSVLSLPFLEFGNHVGDWEHTMLRFSSPTSPPDAVWYSQHANGQAFRYSAVEREGDRPVVYVSRGSHANYAITGKHSHVIPNLNLPFGTLLDYTDKGKRWDSTGSSYAYRFDAASGTFTAFGDAPVEWLGWKGRWGDEAYPNSDKRQVSMSGQKKYTSGPTGPADKQLNREKVCPDNGIRCILRSVLVPRGMSVVGDSADSQAQIVK